MKQSYTFILALLIAGTFLGGCSLKKESGAGDYLLPWPDADGNYSLQYVKIETLESPNQASGPAAEIFVNPNFSESGYSGPIAQPKVTKINGNYHPEDVNSGMALAAYAQYERLWKFENRVFGKTNIYWPRRVGIELQLLDFQTGAVEHSNARFYSRQDVTAFFPFYGDKKHLALSLNASILSHEHFHAHFDRSVLAPVIRLYEIASLQENFGEEMFSEEIFYPGFPSSPGIRYEVKSLEQMNFSTHEDFNYLVLRAWNEGLADFYAAVYTRSPKMMNLSLDFLVGLDERNVDGQFSGLLNREAFKKRLIEGQNSALKDADESWCSSLVCAYRQGTQVARLLYSLASTHEEREILLQVIVRNLPSITMPVAESFAQRDLQMDEVIGFLLKDFRLSGEQCEVLRKSISNQVFAENFSSCFQ